MGGPFRAFLDASVLYPVSLRNLLMRLTLAGLFQARWSPHVHEEWVKAVLRDHPHIPRARLHELRDAMDERAEDSLVTGYERLIASLTLPDPNDRHVLAAAIFARANIIVTCNLRDFPQAILDSYGIEAQHPDEFLRHLLDQSADRPARIARFI
jgi:predicted nucleic acid-binding protein